MKRRALLILSAGLGWTNSAGALPAEAGVYPGTANYSAQAAPADNAVYEILGRLEQLQAEVQQLRGMVEEQAQTIADLERKQTNMYSDLDGRLQALAPAPAQNPPAPAQAPAAETPAPAQTPAVPPASAGAAAAAAQPAPVQNQPAQASPAPAPASTAGNEKERYQQAYEALRNGHNLAAVKQFEALLGDFPAGEFADNAQYWLGEAYKINREYDKARAAFAKVVGQYPNSSKVPDALLKLGYIEFEQQNPAKARDYLTRVVTSYPGSTAAHLASKRLAQLP